MFSSRLDWGARPNALTALLADKRLRGERVIDMTESNPTHAGIEYPSAVIARAFADERSILYEPEPLGLQVAREAVSKYYLESGLTVDPSRIVLTASTSEAYAYLFKLLTDSGDEILIPRPSYPLFEYLARLESIRIVQYPLFYDHGWHLDSGALRSLVTARTRAIVTVHPNNPTGSFLKQYEFNEMMSVAAEHNLAIISDEVFSDYGFSPDPGRMGVAAAHPGVLTFSVSGLSKIVGLPQMKLGWIVVGGPGPSVRAALERLELIADTYLSVGTPVQLAVSTLLTIRKGIQEQIRSRLLRNLEQLRTAAPAASPLRLLEPEGGWYATLQVPRVRSEEEWVSMLLRDHDVLAQPGFFYDFGSEAFLVVSLLTPTELFAEGSRIICSNQLLRP